MRECFLGAGSEGRGRWTGGRPHRRVRSELGTGAMESSTRFMRDCLVGNAEPATTPGPTIQQDDACGGGLIRAPWTNVGKSTLALAGRSSGIAHRHRPRDGPRPFGRTGGAGRAISRAVRAHSRERCCLGCRVPGRRASSRRHRSPPDHGGAGARRGGQPLDSRYVRAHRRHALGHCRRPRPRHPVPHQPDVSVVARSLQHPRRNQRRRPCRTKILMW